MRKTDGTLSSPDALEPHATTALAADAGRRKNERTTSAKGAARTMKQRRTRTRARAGQVDDGTELLCGRLEGFIFARVHVVLRSLCAKRIKEIAGLTAADGEFAAQHEPAVRLSHNCEHAAVLREQRDCRRGDPTPQVSSPAEPTPCGY